MAELRQQLKISRQSEPSCGAEESANVLLFIRDYVRRLRMYRGKDPQTAETIKCLEVAETHIVRLCKCRERPTSLFEISTKRDTLRPRNTETTQPTQPSLLLSSRRSNQLSFPRPTTRTNPGTMNATYVQQLQNTSRSSNYGNENVDSTNGPPQCENVITIRLDPEKRRATDRGKSSRGCKSPSMPGSRKMSQTKQQAFRSPNPSVRGQEVSVPEVDTSCMMVEKTAKKANVRQLPTRVVRPVCGGNGIPKRR